MDTPFATALCHFCAGLDLRGTIGRILAQRRATLRKDDAGEDEVEDASRNSENGSDQERPPEFGGENNPHELDAQGNLGDAEIDEEGAAVNRDDDEPGVVSLESPWLGCPLDCSLEIDGREEDG